MQFHQLSGLYYRIVPASRAHLALDPAVSPEGRFHHDGQPALYASSRPDWAEHAIKAYVRSEDPPRLICEIEVRCDRVLDLRDARQCADWGVDPHLAAMPWLPERRGGHFASTWRVSDLARQRGADGMVYTARSAPDRWHLVLFNWTRPPGAVATATRRTLSYPYSSA